MKISLAPTLILLVTLLAACERKTEVSTPAAGDSAAAAVKVDAQETMAGDKSMMAQMIRLAESKGTFNDALALALQDSAFANSLMAVVRSDARFAEVRSTTVQRASAEELKAAALSSSTSAKENPVPAGLQGEGVRIAGDKNLMADLFRRAQTKGTFDDGLAIAIQHSASDAGGELVLDALRGIPQFAALRSGAPATAAAVASSKGAASSRGRTVARSATSARGGDVLDKAERTMHTANAKLDQAQRVRDQIDAARRKAGGIFKP